VNRQTPLVEVFVQSLDDIRMDVDLPVKSHDSHDNSRY
jgi:hypothetical protein